MNWGNINDWGSLASILGLFVTMFTLYTVRKLRQQYLLKNRLPELAEKINQKTKKFTELNRDYEENKDEIIIIIKELQALLSASKNKVSISIKRDIKKSIDMIKKTKKWSEAATRKVYEEIMLIKTSMAEYLKDIRTMGEVS